MKELQEPHLHHRRSVRREARPTAKNCLTWYAAYRRLFLSRSDNCIKTVLQQHVNFFDKDNDRVIWPLDTFYGFHQIGFNVVLALVSMLVIHFGFRYAVFLYLW